MKFSKYMIVGALGAMLALGACGKKEAATEAETATPAAESAAPAAATNETAAPAAAPAAAAISDEDKEALAKLPAPFNTADLANGAKVFAQCKTCHTMDKAGKNGVGPDMYGLVGRKSGTKEGFVYSDAMKAAGKTWDLPTLNEYVKAPKTFIPGNKMAFVGVPNDKNRTDVLAYIAVKSKE